MSDTANTKVTGIQNVPVSPTTPTDGYVLTYVESNSSWEPQPQSQRGFKKEYFTSDGYWTCPDGVTNILVIGAGGGGGGGGTGGSAGGNGGSGYLYILY